MKKVLLTFFLLSCIGLKVFAQCSGTQLNWINPSFEGSAPGCNYSGHCCYLPPSWDICQPGTTPDMQPGCWSVNLPPSNGNSYIGMVDESSANWHEGVSQLLSSPMVAGTQYTFTVDLATTNSTDGGIQPGCVELQIWGNMGGNTGCDESFLCWSSGNVTSLTWQTYTVTFTPTQPWSHLLLMEHNLGCTDMPYILADNLTAVMPVLDNPQFASNTVCVGNATTFTDQSTSAQGTIVSWSWNFGDGNTSTAQSPTHTYAAAGTYSVTLTVTSSVPCVTTVTHSVVVNTGPVATAAASNGGTVCSGSNITLNGGANGMTSYSWSGPGGFTSASQNPVVSPAVAGTYTLTVSNGACTGTASTTVALNPLPTATATASNGGNVCSGSNITLTGGANGMASYSWSGPGGFTSTLQSPVVSPAVAGTYTLTVSDGTCTNTATTTVNISASPTATATNNGPVCSGTSATLTGGANGMTSYSWSGPGGYTSTLQSPVISPAVAGTYTLIVTGGNGCTASSSTSIALTANPVANAGSNVAIPMGTSTTLTGSGSGGSGSYTYSWSPAGSLVNPTSATPTTVNLFSNTTYTLTVTDVVTGCTSTSQVTVTVSGPVLTVVATATPMTICSGQSSQLNANAAGGSGSYSYSWASNPAGLNSGIVNPVVSPTTNTTYTVTVNDGFNTATSSVNVTVNPLPLVYNITGGGAYCSGTGGIAVNLSGSESSVNYQLQIGGTNTGSPITGTGGVVNFGNQTAAGTYTVIATNPTTGCQNPMAGSVTISINPLPTTYNIVGGGSYCTGVSNGVPVGLSGSQTGVNYQLQNGGVNVGSLINGTGNSINFGNQLSAGTYTVIATDGTTSCQNTMTGTVTITVNPSPVAFAGIDTTICNGSNIPLIATGGGTYMWSNGISSASNSVHPNATTTYTVTVTNGNSCTASDNVIVTVKPFTPPNIMALGPQGFCAGSTNPAVLSASNGYTSYLWSTGATTQTISVTTVGTYWVIGTTANGCSDTSSAMVLQNFPAAIVPVIVPDGPTDFCEGDTILVDLHTTNPYYAYDWSCGSVTPFVSVTHAGFYNVTVTDSNGCTAVSNTIQIKFIPKPVAYFNYSASGQAVDFYDYSLNGQTYFWNFGDGTTSTSQDPNHSYSAPGQYTVTFIVSNLCGSDTSIVTITVVSGAGIVENNYLNNIFVYPIPTNGNLDVSFDYIGLNELELKIYNLLGQNQYIETVKDLTGKYHGVINMSMMPTGVYFMQIKSDKGTINIKVVKD